MPVLPNRVKQAREALGLSQTELARLCKVKPQSIQQLEAGHVKNPRYLHRLADVLSVPWQRLVGSETEASAALGAPTAKPALGIGAPLSTRKDLPVYPAAQAGASGMAITFEPIEWVQRPASLEGVPGAFAFYVVGTSMEPRYNEGELVHINPAKPVRRGHDVLVIVKGKDDEQLAYIKKLARITEAELTLEQYNPRGTMTIKRRDVLSLHRVMGVDFGD